MPGIGVIYNRKAGRNRRDPKAPYRLARRLGDHGTVVAPDSIDALMRAAEDFRKFDIDVLGIAGGDGTNHVTLTGFRDVYGSVPLPTVALLRGGTMNTVANAIGVPPGRPDGLLDRLVLRYLETPRVPTVEQWTIEVGPSLGFMWGLGTVANFLTMYYESGVPSPWTGFKTLARGVGSAFVGGPYVKRMTRGVHAEVELDNGEHWGPRDFFAIAGATMREIGLGFKPFHRAHEVRGAFHLLGIYATPVQFVLDLPRIHRAEGMRDGRALESIVRRATVRTDQSQLQYMIDGDVATHPSGEITVSIGPSVRIATMN